MSVFTQVETVFGSGGLSVFGVADLELATVNGQWMLYSACATDYSLGAFRIDGQGRLTAQDSYGYRGLSGTLGITGLSSVQLDGTTVLIPLSAYDDKLALHGVQADGDFGTPTPVQGSIGSYMARAAAATSIDVDGTTFTYMANRSHGGFKGYEIGDTLIPTEITSRNDNAKAHLGDIADMEAVSAYGKWFLFATSAMDAGLSSYRLDKNGQTYSKHNVGPEDGIGVGGTTALTTVTAGGEVFVVLAGSATDSLTVFRVNKQGALREKQHILDTGETRFDNVTALESVEVNGRSFVLAGGDDDGITLFELTPRNGKLKLWGVLEDSDAITLDAVSDIEALVLDDVLHLYVTSGHENGITHLTADLGDLAAPIVGTKASEVFDGSDQDDLIIGMNGHDTLRGHDGDDWLVDGPGVDQMEGGAGADVFCFSIDRSSDTIVDYTPGLDRIDLSEWMMLYSMAQLTLNEKSYGVAISFGTEHIRVLSNDLGGQITVDDFTDADFLFG